MDHQLPLFDSPIELEGIEYDLDFILTNPIPAFCARGGSPHCRQTQRRQTSERIRAPSLGNVQCFWCSGHMRPLNPLSYKARLATLWQHVVPQSSPL